MVEYNFLKLIARAQKLGLTFNVEFTDIPDMFEIEVSERHFYGDWGYDTIEVLTHGMGDDDKDSYDKLEFFLDAFETKISEASTEGKLTREEIAAILNSPLD